MTAQLLQTPKEYFIACFVYVLIALMKVYEVVIGPPQYLPTASFELNRYLGAIVTILILGFLAALLRKTKVKLEVAVIFLTLAIGFVELAMLLPNFGFVGITIPHLRLVSVWITTLAAILATVRTYQVWRSSRIERSGSSE